MVEIFLAMARVRQTPFYLRKPIEEQLRLKIENGIIEKVTDEPTEWLSETVNIPKANSNEIRICIDMRAANKAIKREIYEMPNIDEIVPLINGLLQISLANIRGFVSNFNLFEIRNRPITPKISLSIYFSQLKFQNENCEIEKLKEFDSFLNFKSLSEIFFGMTVKYFQNTCPFIFKNNLLTKLKINGLADTFVNRNILNFKTINLTENETLNCTISQLDIHVYKGVLNSNLLDKNVFIKLQRLQINGFIDSIDPSFLYFARNFSYLENLQIKLNNFDITLYNSNRWIEKFWNLNSKIFQFRLKLSDYKYPNSDFCLFKNFPIKNKLKISLETYGLNLVANLDRILTSIVNDYYFMDGIYDYIEKPVKNTFSNFIDLGSNYEHIKSI
ncbi:unnamed protein product, partial [Brachionus calyciflorus]